MSDENQRRQDEQITGPDFGQADGEAMSTALKGILNCLLFPKFLEIRVSHVPRLVLEPVVTVLMMCFDELLETGRCVGCIDCSRPPIGGRAHPVKVEITRSRDGICGIGSTSYIIAGER